MIVAFVPPVESITPLKPRSTLKGLRNEKEATNDPGAFFNLVYFYRDGEESNTADEEQWVLPLFVSELFSCTY